MFNIGETVVHKRDICRVTGFIKKYRNDIDYYKLQVQDDSGVTIYSPSDNAFGLLRRPISKQEALDLIEKIPEIPTVELSKLKAAQEYKALVDSGSHTDLVRVIKTSYLRCEQKEEAHKKAGENDKVYFRLAERILYDELAVALEMSCAQARDYVISRVSALATA